MPNQNPIRVLLLLCILGILYLSLYPFTFTSHAKEAIAWHAVEFDSDWVDMFANFLFYLPLGFLATSALRNQSGVSILAATLLGTILSLGVELAQMYLPFRDSSYRDLACNAAGTVAGALSTRLARRLWPKPAILWPSPIAGILIFLWTVWQTFPFFPSLRRPKLHELAGQLPLWKFNAVEFGDIALATFVLYAFVAVSGRTRIITARTVAAILIIVLLAQSLIVGMTFSNARVAAAATGLMIAILFWRPDRRSRWIGLAVVLCVWPVLRTAMPLQEGSISGGSSARNLAGIAFWICATAASMHRAVKLR